MLMSPKLPLSQFESVSMQQHTVNVAVHLVLSWLSRTKFMSLATCIPYRYANVSVMRDLFVFVFIRVTVNVVTGQADWSERLSLAKDTFRKRTAYGRMHSG